MQQYLNLLQHLLEHGRDHDDRTGVGTRRVFGYQFRHDLADGFPLLTTKKVFFRGVAMELLWMLHGHTDNGWLNERGVRIWDEWATAEQTARFGREPGDLGPIYGHQWRRFGENRRYNVGGHDQIRELVSNLINSPGSRRHIVTAWHPWEATRVTLPPCHCFFQCSVRPDEDGVSSRLDLQLYQRSADVFLGVPFNIASYALLTHMLAHACGYQPGEFIHTFGDVHIYRNHFDQVREQLSREPRTLPSLDLNPGSFGGGFKALMSLEYEDIQLNGYDPHPAIKAEVAV